MVDAYAPEGLTLARRFAADAIATARKNVAAMLGSQEAWRRIDAEQLAKLHWHARKSPNARALADFLAEMVPAEFLQSAGRPAAIEGEDAKKNLSSDVKARKLFSAVIEAGLAEQQSAEGKLLVGSAFSAQALERVLDAWLAAGQHRGPCDGSPLSEIDKMLSRYTQSAEEVVQTRLGLMVPVTTAIHIWRLCESLPPEDAQRMEWPDSVQGDVSPAPSP